MIKRAIALSYSAMKDLIREHPELLKQQGFISIIDLDGIKIFDADSPHVITLLFDDVLPETVGTLDKLGGRKFKLFDEDFAQRIIEFLLAINEDPQVETLYVNCGAGIARSGAVVTFVQKLYGLDAERFAADNPYIIPNTWVLQTLQQCWQKR